MEKQTNLTARQLRRIKSRKLRKAKRAKYLEKNGIKTNNENTLVEYQMKVPAIKPRTPKQVIYNDALNNKSIIVCDGPAGCGKTYLAAVHAADKLMDGTFDKIVVTRPILTPEDFGTLPGGELDKFMPFFRPVYDVLVQRLGAKTVADYLKPEVGKIEILPFAFMRGRSLSNAIIILDEAQNTTVSQMKLFLTRAGANSQIIINGDIEQCDLPYSEISGLEDLLTRVKNNNLVSIVNFEDFDCVRSEICNYALEIYRDN